GGGQGTGGGGGGRGSPAGEGGAGTSEPAGGSAEPHAAAASPARQALHGFLARHQRLLLTTHINPDGDGLGSEIAMALWLRAVGKSVRVLNDSLVPTAFAFLTREQSIESWEPELAEQAFAASDALIVLDTSNRQRIGRLSPLLD